MTELQRCKQLFQPISNALSMSPMYDRSQNVGCSNALSTSLMHDRSQNVGCSNTECLMQIRKRREPLCRSVHETPNAPVGKEPEDFLRRVKRNENMNLTRESRILNARKERALRARADLESRAQFEREFREAQMAFLMGWHSRLGIKSPIRILNHDSLLELMARLSFP